MSHHDTHPAIILIARPAAGKSEVIDYLKKTAVEERRRRFKIGEFEEFDDFLYVWQMFEEDDILSKHGKERVWTSRDYYFKDHFIWNLMIEKINVAVKRRRAEQPRLLDGTTAVIEFARGGERAFAEAFSYLSDEILARAGIVYIDVSYEESARKNRKRARKGQEHSVLFHSLPDEKMEYYYKVNDWADLTRENPTHVSVRGHSVPYVVFQNEPEVTDRPDELGRMLEKVLTRLYELRG